MAASASLDELLPRETIDEALIAWIESDIPYFHLVGSPGTGKTSWAELLAERREIGRSTPLAKVVSRHFCRRTQASSWSAKFFLKGTSEQLARSEPAFAGALARTAAEERQVVLNAKQTAIDSPGAINIYIEQLVMGGLSARDALEPLLLAPLREALSEDGPAWILLIDALDEVQSVAHETSLQDLLLGLGDLPSRARIVVTSRPDAMLELELDRLGARRLDLGTGEMDMAALRSFIRHRAEATGLPSRLAGNVDLETVLETLADRAAGNFLAARCAIDMLAESADAVTLDALDNLPIDLAGLYLHFLNRLPAEVRARWHEQSGRIAGVLTVAREPLGEAQIALASGLPASVTRNGLKHLRQYLSPTRQASAFRIFHQTFAEFLGNPEQADMFWLPPGEQHRRFVDWALGEGGAGSGWTWADGYILRNAIAHIAQSGWRDAAARMDALVTPDFLGARIGQDKAGHRLIDDMSLALATARSAVDVKRVLFFGLMKLLWQDRAATRADPASAIVFAASGRLSEALDLAADQDVGGSEEWTKSGNHREFAADLAEMGETDAALDFASRLDAEARPVVLTAIAEAVAPREPERALDLLSEIAGGNHYSPLVTNETCRLLARLPRGVDLCWALAGTSPEHQAAVAEGCAAHDLDRALQLADDIPSHTEDWGGERLVMNRHDLRARTIAAYVERNRNSAQPALDEADQRLGAQWRGPDAFRLAAALAEASPDLGEEAFARLDFFGQYLPKTLAVGYLGALGGESLFDRLARHLAQSGWVSPGVSTVCPMLQMVRFAPLLEAPHALSLIESFADRLIACLAESDAPEKKWQLASVLGRLCGRLSDRQVRAFKNLLAGAWSRESCTNQAVAGVATGLAERSTETFMQAPLDLFPHLDGHQALISAARVIVRRCPRDGLQLFDRVSPRAFITRAELAKEIAKQMRLQKDGDPSVLGSKLSRYVEGATFLDVLQDIRQAATRPAEALAGTAAHPHVRVHHLILRGQEEGRADLLREAASLIDGLEAMIGAVVEGETIWVRDLRRRLSVALADCDPELALEVAAPSATFDELRPLAQRLLASDPGLGDPRILRLFLSRTIRNTGMSDPRDLALAFLVELAEPNACRFIDGLSKTEPETARALELALAAETNPGEVLETIAQGDRDLLSSRWAAAHAVDVLARHHPALALAFVERVSPNIYAAEALAEHVAASWPLADWRSGIAAFTDSAWERNCTRTLLGRAGAVEPKEVIESLLSLATPERILSGLAPDRNYTLKDIIVAAASSEAPDPAWWPALAAWALSIDESAPQTDAFIALLIGVERLAPRDRGSALCLIVDTIATGPRKLFLDCVGSVVRAAMAADGSAVGDMEPLTQRLSELLAVAA